jgi:hypothetical protein
MQVKGDCSHGKEKKKKKKRDSTGAKNGYIWVYKLHYSLKQK